MINLPYYEVIVGNIGTVYRGVNKQKAEEDYNDYVEISKNHKGHRAYGEDVTLFEDDEILQEYFGHIGTTCPEL